MQVVLRSSDVGLDTECGGEAAESPGVVAPQQGSVAGVLSRGRVDAV